MKLEAFDVAFKKFQEAGGISAPSQNKTQAPAGGPKESGGLSFGDVFSDAIKQVDSMQKQADQSVEGLTLQQEGYTTHGAMIALEKADAAFQLMNNIRAKIIRAYEDVLRTQV
jgi:flagellar hook-basal body complex protein FliE